jgi:ribosomal protein L9
LKKEAKKIFYIINDKKYKFSKRTKDNDELYGSIKPKEISKTIENLEKIEIKPSQIDLDKEINKIGSYQAKINLHAEVLAKIHIEVVKEKEEN